MDKADLALHEFEEHHYAAAFEGFAALADQGDAHGARMALLMSDHGSRLCGQRFAIEPARHARWLATAQSDCASESEDKSERLSQRAGVRGSLRPARG